MFVTDVRVNCVTEEGRLASGIGKSKQSEASRKRRKVAASVAVKKVKVFRIIAVSANNI